MSVIVFAGPSISAADRAAFPEFRFLPPVRQGELYAAARSAPKAIGIIDGYFDGVPAVWHKEVLWALSEGIAVFGAASMGALRAAELHPFGMTGIGRIFEDFRDGRLTDDDEVALQHGPAEAGYLALSEPMVNVRATLTRAVTDGVLDADSAENLARIAKSQFYQQRNWPGILAKADLPPPQGDAFRAWLRQGKVDQKREDARALLQAMTDHLQQGAPRAIANFAFERTEAWLNAPWHAQHGGTADPDDALILDELRLDGDAYLRTRRAALLQSLASQTAQVMGLEPQPDEIAASVASFRRGRGLFRQQQVENWATENGLEGSEVRRLATGHAASGKLARHQDEALQGAILDVLRLDGRYPVLRDRARVRAGLTKSGTPPLPLLVAWYFESRLGRPVPEDIDAYARELGFSGQARLLDLLTGEFALAARTD
ncbi:TfuA-like protein [Paracoccus litorisediminis]|uniref:TfuA-like core domain-containing protein n=1 Tax=Paracoccus litorisediminis TaxID=2006130 RepID=A0A844HN91_9RHOB|nr:TfuA-like protein [Paracoccus litorisediminis]MTH60508.1 hypothetical protein [Paracoccus litorisediminis]